MKYAVLGTLLFLGACSSTPESQPRPTLTNVMALIEESEASAPNGVAGTFTLKIKTVGKHQGYVYLNTEEDYRDRRNVAVRLNQQTMNEVLNSINDSPEQSLVGKIVVVTGQAKRIRIDFIHEGRTTSFYYYQTHIDINDKATISILN